MSVINQVLNQLDQRGAPPVPEQAMVRAVPPRRRSLTAPLLALALALATGAAVRQWSQTYNPDAPAQSVVSHRAAAVAPVPSVPVPALAPAALPPELSSPVSRLSVELAVPPPVVPSEVKDAKDMKGTKDRIMPSLAAATQPAKEQGRAMPLAPASVPAPAQTEVGELPMKRISPAQLADMEFRKAAALMQQGRVADAISGYETALQLDAGYQAARQALVALLLEGKRNADAERVLHDGLMARPEQTGFAMLLARLQVERGALDQAVATLEKSLPQAGSQGDYHAFLGALLQRQGHHDEAIGHYRIALQQVPGNGIWQMGYGISLQAAQRGAEAKEAFGRALESGMLTPELQAFVQQKLKEL
ncbi:MAG: hypothetical protein A2Z95_03140 [Gallionellales bacterium GWA2_60_18]|nr:MAG: hypothetical protein A2Z95_03140 [Gallionellales bacterium GWA2_60_18]